jgi:hypothetical protein
MPYSIARSATCFCVIALLGACHHDSAHPYIPVLEDGLTKQFNYLSIPQGSVQIMSDLSSGVESADLKNKRFPSSYLKWLTDAKRDGLLDEMTEQQQSQLNFIAGMGTRVFRVSASKTALAAADKALSNADYVQIPLGTCRVKSIIRDTPYQHAGLPQGEDFRLILGTYVREYNSFAKKYGSSGKEEFKFRAVLKVNPFNHTYSFQGADWGNVSEDDWKTSNVP